MVRWPVLAAMIAVAPAAPAHPDLVLDLIDVAREEASRPPEQQEMRKRYALQGTTFFGSPVHEEMTIHSLMQSGILGRPFSREKDAAFVRGVFWNDDPTALLWPDDSSPNANTWGVAWYVQFKEAKKKATESGAPLIGVGQPLLARSHFGDLQFLHGMASRDGEVASATHARIMMWAEFCYRVATGEIAASMRLSAVPVAGIWDLFQADPLLASYTVQDLFIDREVRKVAAGSLLHLIQDSFADGHVERQRTDRTIDGWLQFGRGAIRSFHAYGNQDEKLHAQDDRMPVTLALGSSSGTGEDPVTHGATLLRLIFSDKRADGSPSAEWSTARDLLLASVFPLPAENRNSIAGPGAAYARSAGRAKMAEATPARPFLVARALDTRRLIIDRISDDRVIVGAIYSVHQPGATALDGTDRLGAVRIAETDSYSALGELVSGALVQGVLRLVPQEP